MMSRSHMKSYEEAKEIITSLKESCGCKNDSTFEYLQKVTPETLPNYKIVVEFGCSEKDTKKLEYKLTNGILVCTTFSDGRYYTKEEFIKRLKDGIIHLIEFSPIK